MNQTTTMNGITVPKEYKHQLRKEYSRMTEDEKLSTLRTFIESKKGVILRGEDFVRALDGLTTAPAFVAKLVKKGRIKRNSIKSGRGGYNFSYEWVYGNAVPQTNPVTNKTEAVLVSGRTEYATAYELKRLQAWFLDYMDKTEDMAALAQANKFRKFVMNGGEIESQPRDGNGNEENDNVS